MRFPSIRKILAQYSNTTFNKEQERAIPDVEVNDLIEAVTEEVMAEAYQEKAKEQELIVEREKKQVNQMAEVRTIQFEILKEINGSTFELDRKNGISKISWNGQVDIDAARTLVTMGADSVEFYGYKKLLLDRSKLIEFDTEARVWIKGLLKSRAKQIVKMVDKLAVVKPNTAKGSIFSNFIGSAIKLVMPNLEMQNFNNADEAIEWLL